MNGPKEITDHQWRKIGPYILCGITPEPNERPDIRGAIDGIFWIARNGTSWPTMPEKYGDHQLAMELYKQWTNNGIMRKIQAIITQSISTEKETDDLEKHPLRITPTKISREQNPK